MKSMHWGFLLALALGSAAASAAEERARQELEAGTTSRTMVRHLSVAPPAGATEVSIALPIEFDFGKASLTAPGRATVQQLAQAMNSDELLPQVFIVEGHTDSVGSDKANLALSQQRAQTVKAELVALGVAEVRLDTAGFGELRLLPGIPGDHARNRRVEVVRRVP